MQTCTCLVRTNEMQCTPAYGVTPAEAALLTSEHYNNAGGTVIFDAVLTDEISNNIPAEITRLAAKYGSDKVEKLWPGRDKRLPLTFAEVGIEVAGGQPENAADKDAANPEPVPVKRSPGRPKKSEPPATATDE